MKIYRAFGTLLLVALAMFIGACGSDRDAGDRTTNDSAGQQKEGKKNELVVFAAASLRETMQELGTTFEKETGTRVLFNFAGSNDLAHQIGAARGADLFLSASENWMDTVEKANRVVPGSRRDLLSNTLVLVANSKNGITLATPCDLATAKFKNLALGDPEAVPAGKYARQWMTSTQCNGKPLWDAVKNRVAPAPDVRAALGLVLADPDVLGVVYNTDWKAFSDRTKVLYEVKDGPPIRYVLAQITEGDNPDGGKKFFDFLTGASARSVYEKHGFTPLSSTNATP